MHDFALLKKDDFLSHLPESIAIWVDKGFLGIKSLFPNLDFVIPHKKKPKQDLTEEQKEENKIIGSIRVLSEHAFAGVKRFGAVSQIYRNKGNDKADLFLLIACGLWNLHIAVCSNWDFRNRSIDIV